MKSIFECKSLKFEYDYLAPDGSEIRLLARVKGGGLCHCTLPTGKTSSAVKNKSVEEIWYFLSGEGEMWQDEVNNGKPFMVKVGDLVNIPLGNSFQFKNTGQQALCILIATFPNWPGNEEALPIEGYWK